MNDDILNLEQEKRLKQALAQLPKELEPEHDLWPGIKQQVLFQQKKSPVVSKPKWNWMPSAVAASFIVAMISLGLNFRQPAPNITVVQGSGFIEQYQPVRNDMRERFNERLLKMSPETREVVGQNMLVIEQAVNEIQQALEQDPNNLELNLLLNEILQQEKNFMLTTETLSL